jgi:hypothetical protein
MGTMIPVRPASADRVRYAIAAESVFGVLPAGKFSSIRVSSGNLELERQSLTSPELNPNRAPLDEVGTDERTSGQLGAVLSSGSHDMLLRNAIGSDARWATPFIQASSADLPEIVLSVGATIAAGTPSVTYGAPTITIDFAGSEEVNDLLAPGQIVHLTVPDRPIYTRAYIVEVATGAPDVTAVTLVPMKTAGFVVPAAPFVTEAQTLILPTGQISTDLDIQANSDATLATIRSVGTALIFANLAVGDLVALRNASVGNIAAANAGVWQVAAVNLSAIQVATIAEQGTTGNGAGYTNGDVVTVVGGTLGTGGHAATATLTVVGGDVTAITLLNPGSYTALPSSPASVTGGTGAGLTVNLTSTAAPRIQVKRFDGKTFSTQLNAIGAIDLGSYQLDGSVENSIAIEEYSTDLDTYKYALGEMIDSLTLAVQQGGVAQLTFNVRGKTIQIPSPDPSVQLSDGVFPIGDASLLTKNDVTAVVSGGIAAFAQSVSIQFSNNLGDPTALGQKGPLALILQRFGVTISAQFFKTGVERLLDFQNDQETDFSTVIRGSDGGAYGFQFPRVKYRRVQDPAAGTQQLRIETAELTALFSPALEYTAKIFRFLA